MSDNNLREINGKKIRRQYFALPILTLAFCMFGVPYCMLIVSLELGKFVFSEWVSAIWISVWICVVFSIPWIVLSALNRSHFGKIICVLTEEGIHYKDGFISWSKVTKIEYVIDLPSRYRYDPNECCRAVIYTGNESITLLHAPLHILSQVKKIRPDMACKVSKGSKRLVAILIIACLLLPVLIPFFE